MHRVALRNTMRAAALAAPRVRSELAVFRGRHRLTYDLTQTSERCRGRRS